MFELQKIIMSNRTRFSLYDDRDDDVHGAEVYYTP